MAPNAVDWSEPLVRLEKLPFLIGELLRQGKTREARDLVSDMMVLLEDLEFILRDM